MHSNPGGCQAPITKGRGTAQFVPCEAASGDKAYDKAYRVDNERGARLSIIALRSSATNFRNTGHKTDATVSTGNAVHLSPMDRRGRY